MEEQTDLPLETQVIDPPPDSPPEPVQVIDAPEPPPSPETIARVLSYMSEQRRTALLLQVQAIELFLGFLHSDDPLAARIARIELFLGIKPA